MTFKKICYDIVAPHGGEMQVLQLLTKQIAICNASSKFQL